MNTTTVCCRHRHRWLRFLVLLLLLLMMIFHTIPNTTDWMQPLAGVSSTSQEEKTNHSSILKDTQQKNANPLVRNKNNETNNENNENENNKSPSSSSSSNTTANLMMNQLLEYAYRDTNERNQRSQRFPSVDERVKVLMSNWYLPPCPQDIERKNVVHYRTSTNNNDWVWLQEIQFQPSTPRSFFVDQLFDGKHTTTAFDYVHALNRTSMKQQCSHRYCLDIIEYLFPALDRLQVDPDYTTDIQQSSPAPILFQFGDGERTKIYNHTNMNNNTTITTKSNIFTYPNLPIIKKFRRSISYNDLQHMTTPTTDDDHPKCYMDRIRTPTMTEQNNNTNHSYPNLQPIVWKLKTRRHYQRIYQVPTYDIPWEHKKDAAVFRGELTGAFPRGYPIPSSTPYQRCQLFPRCRLVLHQAIIIAAANTTTTITTSRSSSLLVDAKLTSFNAHDSKQIPQYMSLDNPNGGGDNGRMVNVSLYGDTKTLQEMLQYKALIMLEGNDVSSGLKWGLFSNSVVIMPPPTFTSWAMEELLQPFVHYIPLENVEDDVQVKMQWVLDHDAEAQAIARAGKLWISDLIVHEDAPTDEEQIFDEIVKRYQAHFVRDDETR